MGGNQPQAALGQAIAASEVLGPAASQFQAAMRHYQGKRYPEARQAFEQLTREHPHISEAWLNLGNAYYQQEMLDKATESWERALVVDPMEGKGYLNLGNVCFKQQRYPKAIAYWRQFLQLFPERSDVMLNIALAYEHLNAMDEAFSYYKAYLSLEKNALEAVQIRERFKAAKSVYQHNAAAAHRLAQAGRIDKAIQAFEAALKGYPGEAKDYKCYAALLYKQNRFENALAVYEQAYRLSNNDPAVLVNLGVLYERLGNPSEALWAYSQAADLPSPQKSQVRERLKAFEANHPTAAAQGLEKLRQLLRQYYVEDATRLLQRMRALSETMPAISAELTGLAQGIAEMNNLKLKAVKVYQALANQAVEEGKFQQAMHHYQRLIAAMPESAEAKQAAEQVEKIQGMLGAVVSAMLKE